MDANRTKNPEFFPLAAAFVALLLTTSSLEGIWYLGIAEEVYQHHIGLLMNDPFDARVAILFYLSYSMGALIFAVRPALVAQSWRSALQAGALFGFFCFSAHNLTDLADVKGFTWEITVIDIAWGTCMTGVASTLAFLIARCLGRHAALNLPRSDPR